MRGVSIIAFALATTLVAATMMSASAFTPHDTTSATRKRRRAPALKASSQDSNELSSRRTWMTQVTVAGAAGTTLLSTTTASSPANALVYVDPDRYGDKELQVGMVNKVRQCVRDAILGNVQLAPLFLQIAIQDALSYNTLTQAGGPNGRIVHYLLETKQPEPLYRAAQELQAIRAKLQRATEITMADVVTFAGAEAIESLGGPRIVVQLGKLDYYDSEKAVPITIYDLTNGPETIDAFKTSGLTEREVTLLLGAMGSMEQVIVLEKEHKTSNTDTTIDTDDDDEENEMGDPKVDFPTSFGAPSQIYGKRLGRMDDSIFKEELALQKRKKATGVWKNDVVGEWTTRYASKGGFFKDLPEAYSRLVQVGSTGRWEV